MFIYIEYIYYSELENSASDLVLTSSLSHRSNNSKTRPKITSLKVSHIYKSI